MQGGGQRGAHYDYIRRFVAMAQCAVRLQQVGKPSGREQFEKYIEFSRQARALSVKIAAGKDGEGGLESFDGPAGQVSVDIPAAETFMAQITSSTEKDWSVAFEAGTQKLSASFPPSSVYENPEMLVSEDLQKLIRCNPEKGEISGRINEVTEHLRAMKDLVAAKPKDLVSKELLACFQAGQTAVKNGKVVPSAENVFIE